MTATRRPHFTEVGPSGVPCEGCERILPGEAFYVRKESGRLRSRCKECEKKVQREVYLASPEKRQRAVENAARWAAANPEKARAAQRRVRRKASLRDKYGMTVEDWDAMLVAQSGRCAICEEPMRKPCVDHCHGSLAVRGLLCAFCNTGLGNFRDDPTRLQAAIDYLTP